jgi:DNA (cytosine-5)-methyltransferase 1
MLQKGGGMRKSTFSLSKPQQPKLPRVRVVDLFCGAGGLSLGLQRAGLEIAAGCDLDPACQFAYERNVKAPFHKRDVAELTAEELTAWYGQVDIRVLAACAPCQPFSGYVVGRYGEDQRWRLLNEVERLVTSVLPEIVTVENVSRLSLRPMWSTFVDQLENLGYATAHAVVDCASYGVPQRRRRLIMLASRIGVIDIPVPQTGPAPTVRDTIGHLRGIAAGTASDDDRLQSARALTPPNLARIQASRPGGSWKEWEPTMRARCHRAKTGKTYPSVYGRMEWDKPSPTITTQFYGFGNGRFGHPDQDRALTLREGALLQTFPSEFEFAPTTDRTNFRQVGKLIGNAVPVNLGVHIGAEIASHISSVHGGARKKRRSVTKRSTAVKMAST